MRWLFLVLAVAACTPATSHRSTDVVLGVLEDRPGANAGEAPRFVVRAAFRKQENAWRAYEANTSAAAFPQTADWTIAYRGEAIGQLRTRVPQTWTSSGDVGRMEITSGEVPSRGERSSDFAGWVGEPVFRPLVALTTSSVADPQQWTALMPSNMATRSARQASRTHFSQVVNCANASSPATPFDYADDQIDTSNGYFSTDGWTIITLRLTGYRCDGPIYDTPFNDQAFAVSRTGETTYLGEGLRFIDAGDYDGDGKSEIVFAVDRYNLGGYVLFTDDFAQHAEFTFGYH